jgi:hypothetical protein
MVVGVPEGKQAGDRAKEEIGGGADGSGQGVGEDCVPASAGGVLDFMGLNC